jgi:hypothetical protein
VSKPFTKEGKAGDEADRLAGQAGWVGPFARALLKAHVVDELRPHP